MEKIKDTTESYTTWLEQILFTVINMKTNSVVYQKHQLNYIDAKFTVHYKKHHITLYGMVC